MQACVETDRTLCDTQTRGQLDCVEFAISMHLIKLVMNGNISTLPSSLEPSLMKHTRELLATHMFSPPRQSFQASSSSSPSSFPPVASPLPHIVTADPYSPQTLYPTPTPSPPLPVASSSTSAITFEDSPWTPSDPGWDWDVSPVLKVEADDLFDALDPGNTGFLADDIAVEFMKNFNMKEDVLSLIWSVLSYPSFL
jgi:epidermal growth factor receptor substrate 15